ncbi:MAG: PIN domain nuclease [SAR202 cluster bacterium]|nr:PIN domain nuclease [SAR202 cluster bacterium]
MVTLIDTSLWIDFTRARSPQSLKQFIAPHILRADASLAEPVVFEVLRYASSREIDILKSQFEAFPMLSTPSDLWSAGIALDQACSDRGFKAGAMDLLIATTAIYHNAMLVTFDDDFRTIAAASSLRVELLQRPVTSPN